MHAYQVMRGVGAKEHHNKYHEKSTSSINEGEKEQERAFREPNYFIKVERE